MIAKAEAKYIRISPFKIRPVVAAIKKGSSALNTLVLLDNINKKGAYYLKKAISSAIANAYVKGYDKNNLIIERIVVNPGPSFKRYRAASFGRASIIRKRTSHIIVELDSREASIKV